MTNKIKFEDLFKKEMNKTNPSETFQVSVLERRHICYQLNSSESYRNLLRDDAEPLTIDDKRLTKEICEYYANQYGEITNAGLSKETLKKELEELGHQVLLTVGLVEDGDKKEPTKITTNIIQFKPSPDFESHYVNYVDDDGFPVEFVTKSGANRVAVDLACAGGHNLSKPFPPSLDDWRIVDSCGIHHRVG